jgi:Predicted dehydrogenase
MSTKPTSIVIGAGIVGLAMARALGERGHQVTVLERSPIALGASIRNFGMVWPIGQPSGALYERAMRSRSIWKALLSSVGVWHRETGSLLVARKPEEMAVLEEFMRLDGRPSASFVQP